MLEIEFFCYETKRFFIMKNVIMTAISIAFFMGTSNLLAGTNTKSTSSKTLVEKHVKKGEKLGTKSRMSDSEKANDSASQSQLNRMKENSSKSASRPDEDEKPADISI